MAGLRGLGDVRFTALDGWCMQRLNLHESRFGSAKVQAKSKIVFRVFVQNDDRCLSARERCGIGSSIDAGGLKLRGEIGLDE